MQVFAYFKWSPEALQVFRPLGDRCQEACWADCLAPKGRGTTDTAENVGHKHLCTLTLSLSLLLSVTHTRSVNLKHCIPKLHFVQTLSTDENI